MPFITPSNKTLIAGVPIKEELKLTTGTDCYAGRLATKGSDDEYGLVCTAITPPAGFISYEDSHANYQPATYATAFAADDIAAIIKGAIVVKGKMATGVTCVKGDLLANWAGGLLVPVAQMAGGLAVKVPFANTATVATDTITLPAGVIVKEVIVQVVTAVASSTIDIGLKTTDTDGFVDGLSCAAAGLIALNTVDATAANITRGALVTEVEIIDATGTPVYYAVPITPGYLVAAAEALSYTTTDHAIAGFMWVVIDHPSFQVVGRAEADAASAADVQVRCLL